MTIKEDLEFELNEVNEKIEELEQKLSDIENDTDSYDDWLDDNYDDVVVAGYRYKTSDALKSVDNIAYRSGFIEYANNAADELKSEIKYLDIDRKKIIDQIENWDEE